MALGSSHQPTRGFTIIEVMIVLAIAGFIALLIFQAIPTLTRNSRNSQRRDGVAGILRAVSRYELNNSGAMPPACNGAACFGANTFTSNQQLVYYTDPSNSTINVCAGGYNAANVLVYLGVGCSGAAVTSTDDVALYNYRRCSETPPGTSTPQAAGYSDVVAMFAVENGNGTTLSQCQQL